jgi:hypothetical protein
MMIEGSGSGSISLTSGSGSISLSSGSGSISLTSGSGSRRLKNMWIRWIRIRNTEKRRTKEREKLKEE